MEEQIKTLINKRGGYKGQLTRFIEYLNSLEINQSELSIRVKSIEKTFEKCIETQSKIEELNPLEASEWPALENSFFKALGIAKTKLGKFTETSTSTELKLSPIQLTTFRGSYETWSHFRGTFASLVGNSIALSNLQKFHYLISGLSGEANKLVSSLEVSEANYKVAWDILEARYDNKRIIIDRHVKLLFSLATIKSESHVALRSLVDEAQLNLRALQSLGLPTDKWDMLVIHIIANKLDSATRCHWENYPVKEVVPKLEELFKCLSERARVLESTSTNKVVPVRAHGQPKLTLHVNVESACSLCDGQHMLSQCEQFKRSNPEFRSNHVKAKKLCFNCLSNKHKIKACKSKYNCRKCGKRHHTLIHIIRDQSEEERKTQNNDSSQEADISLHSSGEDTVLLSTAIIGIQLQNGTIVKARALLDNGSQSNFITEKFCNKLGLKTFTTHMPISTLQKTVTSAKKYVDVRVKSLISDFNSNIKCYVLQDITSNIPLSTLDRKLIQIPKGVQLADPEFHRAAEVDILLGSKVFWETLRQQERHSLQPLLKSTEFGWIVGGHLSLQVSSLKRPVLTYCNFSLRTLHDDIKKFWTIEERIVESSHSKEESLCEEHFLQNCSRDTTGRFKVGLPFKQSQPDLGESYQQALKRLHYMEKRFTHDKEFYNQYCNFMNEYQALGHMSVCESPSRDLYYLPHHAVFKGDKIRIVFDGSCKSSNGKSLNDALMVGPVIQNTLYNLLLHFRKHRYVLVADITQMYRQILINEEDRKYQTILWRNEPHEEIRSMTLNTVTYGLAPSSFLATRCLKELSILFKSEFPLACNIIENNFYMDDLIAGCDDISTCNQVRNDLIYIFDQVGMKLAKWRSNFHIDENPNMDVLSFSEDHTSQSTILGLCWNSFDDNFTYKIRKMTGHKIYTKRIILSEISRLYDPLGLVSPIIVKFKLLMQELWQLQIGWDKQVPDDVLSKWQTYKDDLMEVCSIHIPRCIKIDNPVNMSLVGFSDASESAYGCAIYLHSEDETGMIKTQLICSKSKVAPLKKLSLARLELCAAVMLTTQIKEVQRSLEMENNKTYLWTDSMIVLYWIKGPPSKWNTFVANRVSQIQNDMSDNCQWRHVSSKENPSDIITRGTNVQTLKSSSLWSHGPPWLSRREQFWPQTQIPECEDLTEAKLNHVYIATRSQEVEYFTKFSSFTKTLRVTAYVFRFINNSRKGKSKLRGPLSVQEINAAHDFIIRKVQQHCFAQEIHDINRGVSVSNKSKIKSLNPFMRDNIICVGGRLSRSSLPEDQKHPILLPHDHHVTTLIIRWYHYSNLHLGTQGLLAQLRLKYWIVQGKNTVKKILRKCIMCFRFKPQTATQLMGDLPADRVTSYRPFYVCGVDYFGPAYIKSGMLRNSKIVKGYFCIFICFSTKAIHLDIAVSLETESFLNVLRRFIARRGRPHRIYSDNGTNFQGASREIDKMFGSIEGSKNAIVDYLSQNYVQWQFIPARSPHHGGLWENGVKLAKTHLKKATNGIALNYDSYHTLLCQIESILNSRPISALSEDPTDLTPLTPGHFLVGESLSALPDIDVNQIPSSPTKHYRKLSHLLQQFWTRWSTEYMGQLQQRTKWQRDSSRQLQIGDLVLVMEDNLPPMLWKTARVIQTHPGKDKIVRVVTMKNSRTTFKRAVQKLCLLPIDNENIN